MKSLFFLLPSTAFAQVLPIEIIPIPEPGTLLLLLLAVPFLIRYAHRK